VIGAAELLLKKTVHPLDLLLFAQLDSVVGKPDSALAMYARRIRALFDCALLAEAPISLEEELGALATAKSAH
jgi:hypothetical protein